MKKKETEVKADQKSDVQKKLDSIEKLLIETKNCAKIQQLARHNPVGKWFSYFISTTNLISIVFIMIQNGFFLMYQETIVFST